MRKVPIDEVENVPNPLGVHSVRRPVSDGPGTEHFAMNYLELEPGESFSGGLPPTTTRRCSASSRGRRRSN
jgi:hypothetical protein